MNSPSRFCMLTIAWLCLALSLTFTPAMAQRKKAKRPASTSSKGSRGQTRSLASRNVATRGKRVRAKKEDTRPVALPTATVPDQIEVVEYGSTKLTNEARAATRPLPRATPDPSTQTTNFNISTKRLDVDIDSRRVIEIQEALAKKGFYQGVPTGVYDETTMEAMRQFQASNQIDVTGYPTAHALKRLGLTNW